MFHSATLKLTGLYLGILAIICIFFSVNLYQVTVRELDNGLNRQAVFFQELPRIQGLYNSQDIFTQREAQITQGKQRVVLELIYMNALLLILGGAGSYLLAKHTLKPIQEAHDAQSRFTSDASHELRTPLAAMQMEIEVALRDPKLSLESTRKLLKSNLEELNKLTVLSERLLCLARQDSLELQEKVLLNEVIQEAIKRIEPLAQKKAISIHNELKKDTHIRGDYSSLVELLTLLLDNAVKYSAQHKNIWVRVDMTPTGTNISIIDEGIGIKEEDISHLFERFWRADSSRSKNQVSGYGLGLSIAEKIVELHGGSISAKRNDGQGAIFIIHLPSSKP